MARAKKPASTVPKKKTAKTPAKTAQRPAKSVKSAKKAAKKKAPAMRAAAHKAPKTATKKKANAKKTARSNPALWKKAAPPARPVDVRGWDEALPKRTAELLTTASAVQGRMMAARARGLTIGFVPTMGALHDGHAALLEEARKRADVVVCSIFVNPKQFGQSEDLSRYPRPLEADRELCRRMGVDVVFAPDATEVYPPGFDTAVHAGALASDLEGAARPGHFDGVLTVVNLLLHIVQPHFAVFGEKDFQQLTLVRRMVKDLRVPVEIVAMPVIRDVDGLALSSRNAYLSAADRKKAVCLYRAVMAAQDEVQRGVDSAATVAAAAARVLDATAGATVDYIEVRDPKTMAPLQTLTQPARLLLAVRLGGVRLIDNAPLFPHIRYG
jgi:pantoate--beta-alanine ligase